MSLRSTEPAGLDPPENGYRKDMLATETQDKLPSDATTNKGISEMKLTAN